MNRFFSGAWSGAVNSGLMLGIFSLLASVTGIVAAPALPLFALTVATTAIFSGVMAVRKGPSQAESADAPHLVSHAVSTKSGNTLLMPLADDVPAQAVEQETSAPSNWADRVGSRGASHGSFVDAYEASRSGDGPTIH